MSNTIITSLIDYRLISYYNSVNHMIIDKFRGDHFPSMTTSVLVSVWLDWFTDLVVALVHFCWGATVSCWHLQLLLLCFCWVDVCNKSSYPNKNSYTGVWTLTFFYKCFRLRCMKCQLESSYNTSRTKPSAEGYNDRYYFIIKTILL